MIPKPCPFSGFLRLFPCCALLLGLVLPFCAFASEVREQARLWLENLEEEAAALRTLPELSLSRVDDDRLLALAEALTLSSWTMLEPESVEETEGHQTGQVLNATGPEWQVPECAALIARLRREERQDSATLPQRAERLLHRAAALDRMESLIAGLELVTRRYRHSSDEMQSAYMRCVWLLSRYDALDAVVPHGHDMADGPDEDVREEGGDRPECMANRILRQDTLLAALDAALSFRLRKNEALPLHLIRAGLLLEQSRPQAALASLERLEHASCGTAREKRLRVRGLYLRAQALMRTGNFALAGRDLDSALKLNPEGAELRLARGTLLRLRGETTAMCGDFHAACASGLCEGLEAARAQGYCGAAAAVASPAALLELKR